MSRWLVHILLPALLVTGCVSLPPERHVTSLAEIAGGWRFYFNPAGFTPNFRVEMNIGDDGTFRGRMVEDGTGGNEIRGTFRLDAGRLTWEETFSHNRGSGVATLHDDGHRRVLRLIGARAIGGSVVWNLTPIQ